MARTVKAVLVSLCVNATQQTPSDIMIKCPIQFIFFLLKQSFLIVKVGATYGRKMMTGHIKHSTAGLRLGVNRVGQALKRVNPRQHHERQTSITRHLNPVPYYAEYFGHKLHLDQNEKLISYGVTEVIAVDGYSSFITATSVMPLKNNITIYRDVFRLALT